MTRIRAGDLADRTPAQVLLTLFPNLTPAEKEEIGRALGLIGRVSPCEAAGHKLKTLDRIVRRGWFGRTFTISRVHCERCGIVRAH